MTETEILDANRFLEYVDSNYRKALLQTFGSFVRQKRRFIDASVDEEDLYQSMLAALPRYVSQLQKPAVDKKTGEVIPLIARLCRFARRHALFFIKKIKLRFETIERNPYARAGKYCEAFTPLEMAARRASEFGDGELGPYERHENL